MNLDSENSSTDIYRLSFYKCELKGGLLIPRGSRQTISLKDARAKFCPTTDPRGKQNLIRAQRGNYLGIRQKGNKLHNFLLVNRTDTGDIRWLLKKIPDLNTSIIEVYLVDQVDRQNNTVDLPSVGSKK